MRVVPDQRAYRKSALQLQYVSGERIVTTDEIELVIKASMGKTVSVVYMNSETENLFVHNVDDEGFVCDLASEMTDPAGCAYWVRFRDVREVRPTEGESFPKS